jgi:hypothetical protein
MTTDCFAPFSFFLLVYKPSTNTFFLNCANIG